MKLDRMLTGAALLSLASAESMLRQMRGPAAER